MIKINKAFSSDFKETYVQYALNVVLWPNISKLVETIPHIHRKLAKQIFNKRFLEVLLRSEPASFEDIIQRLYTLFPYIAERYCYSYLLKEIDIATNIINMATDSPSDRSEFDKLVNRTIQQLKRLTSRYRLYLTPFIIAELESSIPRYKKKKYLCRLENAFRGHSQITERDRALFPAWVNQLPSCFDYDAVSQELGQAITEQLEITVCPYCGLESIQTYSSISVRPDLDHFYPRTRFPFLAISLYNLIPAGSICNQKLKRNNSMLGHMHPHIEGLDNDPMFRFGFLPDGDIRNTFCLDILQQNSNAKNNNLKLFKIKGMYNGNEDLREWYCCTYELREFLKQEGEELTNIDFMSPLYKSVIDIRRPNTKVSAQKFKIEALNELFHQTLCIVDQPML
ncbi:hypothetical protein HU715_000195 [Pseudomonas sp. SWRI12]|uniref:HNH nuclease domain-containing protein n=1 Tax=Pseudomonas zanjanensis TaxID=2745496 RepID=A0A923FB66_9PSED|nr:hypothetical protein [Pseudomonas zanjanensis]MBV4493759.1 hypothetical protein [Pseudomonas zanjanensis]